MPLSGREKATIFLSILGADISARVLRYLPDELADLIASGINHLPSPSPTALTEVLEDFNSFLAIPAPETPPMPLISEKPMPVRPKRSYGLLLYERPQMTAFLLSLLSPSEQQEALTNFPRDKNRIEEIMHNLKRNAFTIKL